MSKEFATVKEVPNGSNAVEVRMVISAAKYAALYNGLCACHTEAGDDLLCILPSPLAACFESSRGS